MKKLHQNCQTFYKLMKKSPLFTILAVQVVIKIIKKYKIIEL